VPAAFGDASLRTSKLIAAVPLSVEQEMRVSVRPFFGFH